MRHIAAWKYLIGIFTVFWVIFAIILIISDFQIFIKNPWSVGQINETALRRYCLRNNHKVDCTHAFGKFLALLYSHNASSLYAWGF